jgi:hypothetical protein
MASVAKFAQPIPIFLAYLVPLDVDVAGKITTKLCEVLFFFHTFLSVRFRGDALIKLYETL